MKKLIPILLITALFYWVSSCEKDDICVDGDTPLLVLGFFDVNDTTAAKAVPSIRIKSIDIDSVLTNSTFGDRSNSPDSLQVPLRSNAVTTMYQIISGSKPMRKSGISIPWPFPMNLGKLLYQEPADLWPITIIFQWPWPREPKTGFKILGSFSPM